MSAAATARSDKTGAAISGHKKAPELLTAPGPICGSGRSPRALSRWHTLGRARFRGRCASRRHSPRHADVSVSWRDRPSRYRPGSRSEASSPGSDAPCRERRAGRGADTPAIFIVRVGTVATGTAPAFGRTLAPRYGSDLLPPRLLSLLQRGDVLFHAAPLRSFADFA
jgi:hypothetical protein